MFPATMSVTGSNAPALPTEYIDCHGHGADLWCMTPDGKDEFLMRDEDAPASKDNSATPSDGHGDAVGGEEENCHFHAGVE